MTTHTESTYVGTKLTPDEHRAFSIKAAESGKSRSAMLRDLAVQFIKQSTTRRVSAATDSAGRRATPRRSGSRRKEVV